MCPGPARVTSHSHVSRDAGGRIPDRGAFPPPASHARMRALPYPSRSPPGSSNRPDGRMLAPSDATGAARARRRRRRPRDLRRRRAGGGMGPVDPTAAGRGSLPLASALSVAVRRQANEGGRRRNRPRLPSARFAGILRGRRGGRSGDLRICSARSPGDSRRCARPARDQVSLRTTRLLRRRRTAASVTNPRPAAIAPAAQESCDAGAAVQPPDFGSGG